MRPVDPLPDGGRAAGVAMLFEVTLVILLGPVKRGRRSDLGNDLPPARLLLGIARCDRGFLLASVMVEDRRTVLAAEIEALAVAGGRIVDPPEHLKQLCVADLGRVEPHLDRLGVAGAVPADLSIAGVRDVAAGVADSGPQHPMDLAEGRLDTPEASRSECRALGSIRSVSLEWRRRRQSGVAVPELNHFMTSSNVCANKKPTPGIPAYIGRCRRGRPQVAAARVTAVMRAVSARGAVQGCCRLGLDTASAWPVARR